MFFMKEEEHEKAFREHKETIFDWGLEHRGISNSQRIVGLNASRAIVELLSLYLHRKKLVNSGFQINHRWFKSKKIYQKIPDFESRDEILDRMIKLEMICEKISYGKSKPIEDVEEAIELFNELENKIRKLK